MIRPRSMTLPPEVVAQISDIWPDKELRHLLRVYMGALVRAGWRLTAISRPVGVSSERVRQLAITDEYVEQSVEEYRLITGLSLKIPEAPIKPPKVQGRGRGRVRSPASPETLERLRRLQAVASKYRGSSRNRTEAQQFVALLWYAHAVEGASLYALAQDLGVTRHAIESRLVRYGYATTNSKAAAYEPLRGRKGSYPSSKTSCVRGHPFDEENTRVHRSTGHRTCKKCERIRRNNYLARKGASTGGES